MVADLDTGTSTSGRDGSDHRIATAPIVRHRGSSELLRGIFHTEEATTVGERDIENRETEETRKRER